MIHCILYMIKYNMYNTYVNIHTTNCKLQQQHMNDNMQTIYYKQHNSYYIIYDTTYKHQHSNYELQLTNYIIQHIHYKL